MPTRRDELTDYVRTGIERGLEVDIPPHFGWVMTYPLNMLGPLPVLSVPTGVQLVARPHDERQVFRVAAALERWRGPWFDTPARYPVL